MERIEAGDVRSASTRQVHTFIPSLEESFGACLRWSKTLRLKGSPADLVKE